MVVRKTPEEIMRMAAAGQALAVISDVLAAAVGPGVTTAELDDLAEQQIRALGGLASFKVDAGFPTAICTSVIDEIVHGIPSGRRLRAGGVLTIDAGIVIDGFHADSTCTWIVGGDAAAPPEVGALVACTSEALWRGIAAMRIGNRLGDVSAAIGTVGERRGYGIVADHDGRVLGGHGIGRRLHEDPLVLNHGRPGRGLRLKPGFVLAIERCSRSAPRPGGSATTAGRSPPPTAPWPPTVSTRSRSRGRPVGADRAGRRGTPSTPDP